MKMRERKVVPVGWLWEIEDENGKIQAIIRFNSARGEIEIVMKRPMKVHVMTDFDLSM